MLVGVIGTGALGRHHARLYNACPQAELVGVFDASRASAEEVAAQTGTRAFGSVAELAAACSGLSVAVPSCLHHRIALPLLQAGKHLLVEKPLAATVAEGRELVETAVAAGVVLAVGHVERFSPALAAVDALPGPVQYLCARRCMPYPPARPGTCPRGCDVSIAHDLMVHDADLCLALMGDEPVHVSAMAQTVFGGHEDYVSARLTFADGRMADLTASRLAAEPVRELLVAKAGGHAAIDLRLRQASVRQFVDHAVVCESFPVEETNPLADELADFCLAATGALPGPRVDGRAGLRALALVEKILAAARAGGQ